MTTLLVAEDHRDTRELLVDILQDSGYDVISAEGGGVALEKAVSENPDLILLDVSMPFMDGWEVLKRLRENPETKATPVVMVTAVRPAQGELAAWRLGARHYIAKPFTSDRVVLAVKVALSEAEETADRAGDDEAAPTDEAHGIGTGSQSLNQILGGGIPLGSLTLIEGTPKSGKSVLCQHIGYESLQDGLGVTYFVSGAEPEDLVPQMESIGLDVTEHYQSGMLRAHPMKEPGSSDDPDCLFTPDRLMAMLADDIGGLPDVDHVVFIDSITMLASESEDKSTLRFFSAFRRMCDAGKTIVLASHSHAFDDGMLTRLRDLCDAHMRLRMEKMGMKQGTLLEVTKAGQVELSTNNTVSFDVQPGVGIQMLAFGKVRA
jgi:flagellar protein FlaH